MALLRSLSSRLRGDAASAVARSLLARTPCFAPVSELEVDFLANVTLALTPALRAPREPLGLPRTLVIIERGIASDRGRIVLRGGSVGHDFALSSDVFREPPSAVGSAVGCERPAIERSSAVALKKARAEE